MATREQKRKGTAAGAETEPVSGSWADGVVDDELVKAKKAKHGEEADTSDGDTGTESAEKADIEGLLDEIDDVLETNAEDFVRNYVQKGGE